MPIPAYIVITELYNLFDKVHFFQRIIIILKNFFQ